MSKMLKKALLAGPAAVGALLAVTGEAMANPVVPASAPEDVSSGQILRQIERYSAEGRGSNSLGQLGASQFRDVSPGDWAYQALDDLVRRYDCLKGYPDGSFRGNRSLSRYEFAAGLNACLQQIERLIAETTAQFATKEDLETLRRLLQEFEAELAALGARVDNLEGRVAFLEDNQFSTTTKLVGEALMNLDVAIGNRRAQPFGFNSFDLLDAAKLQGLGTSRASTDLESLARVVDRTGLRPLLEQFGVTDSVSLGEFLTGTDLTGGPAIFTATNVASSTQVSNFLQDLARIYNNDSTSTSFNTSNLENDIAFGYRARLNFDTSFTGRDRLRTRLEAGNLVNLLRARTGTNMTEPNQYALNTSNNVQIGKLWYYFPIGNKVTFHVGAAGMKIDDIVDAWSTNPYNYDDLPLGLAFNTAFYDTQGGGGAAIGANIDLSKKFGIDIGYFDSTANTGLFDGNMAIPIQLNFMASDRLRFALGYSRTFGKGGNRTANSVGLSTTASVLGTSPFLYVNSSGNIIESATSGNHFNFAASWDLSKRFNLSAYIGYVSAVAESGPRKGDNADMWTWAANLAFPDLGREGSVLLLGFGMLPYLADVQNGPQDRNPSYMLNLEYRFPISDNIQLAPGGYAVFNPDGNGNNNTIVGAMLRTIFNF